MSIAASIVAEHDVVGAPQQPVRAGRAGDRLWLGRVGRADGGGRHGHEHELWRTGTRWDRGDGGGASTCAAARAAAARGARAEGTSVWHWRDGRSGGQAAGTARLGCSRYCLATWITTSRTLPCVARIVGVQSRAHHPWRPSTRRAIPPGPPLQIATTAPDAAKVTCGTVAHEQASACCRKSSGMALHMHAKDRERMEGVRGATCE